MRWFTSQIGPRFTFFLASLMAFALNAVEYCLLASGDKQRQPDPDVPSGGMFCAAGPRVVAGRAGGAAKTPGNGTPPADRSGPGYTVCPERAQAAFLLSHIPELEIWMAHVFGWLPSQDILKLCPKSFTGTMMLV